MNMENTTNGTTTNQTHNNTTTTITDEDTQATKKTSPPTYTAVVTLVHPSGTGSDPIDPQYVTARTRTELAKKLTDPTILHVHAIFRGKRVEFQEQRKINF